MAENKNMVEAITYMDEDFAQWYTDIVKKAELVEYTSVKGCMVIRPYGYAISVSYTHLDVYKRQHPGRVSLRSERKTAPYAAIL